MVSKIKELYNASMMKLIVIFVFLGMAITPATVLSAPIDAEIEGLWYATGHGRNGILLAAITGEIIAQLFTDAPIEYDISPIDPGRFWKTGR